MNKKEKLDNMLCEKNGVLQTADVIEAGISKTYFMEYAKKMELECVAKGAEKTLEDLEKLRTVLSSSRRR